LLAGNSEYTPNAPTKPRVEKSLENPPYCPRSSIERFPENDTEESTPAQQSLASLSLEVPVIEILLDPLAFAPTLPSS
jgi:hypothetical protein